MTSVTSRAAHAEEKSAAAVQYNRIFINLLNLLPASVLEEVSLFRSAN
eukprot:COSAG05_NODE_271_length_12468_cov_8.607810_16_plen_48_part_00